MTHIVKLTTRPARALMELQQLAAAKKVLEKKYARHPDRHTSYSPPWLEFNAIERQAKSALQKLFQSL